MTDLTARVPCTHDTLDRLKSVKEDGERYDDTLQRLISDAENDRNDGDAANV